jgi:TonB family protein
MGRLLLILALGALPMLAPAQESHIGGAQTSNAHVSSSTGNRAASRDSTSGPAGSAHISVDIKPAGAAHAGGKPQPAILNAPKSPSTPVELSDAAFAALVLHREPAVYPQLARSTHATGAIVLDVVVDENGHLESADPIGAEDLSMACMEAIQGWKFAPYRYQGRPWKVSGSVRFNFTNPQKGTSD